MKQAFLFEIENLRAVVDGRGRRPGFGERRTGVLRQQMQQVLSGLPHF